MADINSQLPVKLTDGTLTATVRDTGSNDSLNVAINDGSGNQVTSFGGGTQYTEGDTDATITGTAMLWEDGSDTLRAVSVAKPLPVDIQDTTIAVTQSGTWDEVGINDSGNSITVDQATGSNLHMVVDSGTITTVSTVTAVTAITNALPAGTNAIGKLAANSGVDIGDVTIDNTAANPVPVYFTTIAVTGEVNSYDTTAAVGAAASDNHDYTVTGTTFRLKQLTFAASGKMKVELQVGPVGTLVTKGVWFITSASPSFEITFAQPIEVPVTSTGTVRLIRTNLEAVAQDVYSTIFGIDT